MPGSLQGFRAEIGTVARLHPAQLENVTGHSKLGERSLAIGFRRLAPGRVVRVASPTFFDQEVFTMPTYQLTVSPTLYSGQTVEGRIKAGSDNSGPVAARLYCSVYTETDGLAQLYGESHDLLPQNDAVIRWRIPDTGGYPIYEIGVEIASHDSSGTDGTLYLDYLTWDGAPDVTLRRPDANSVMWKHAWVNNVSQFQTRWEGLRVTNGDGIGFVSQGTRDWQNYEVSSDIMPVLAKAWGLAARVQGRERYYALMFEPDDGGRVRLVKRQHTDTTLASRPFDWKLDQRYQVKLRVMNGEISAFVDGELVFEVQDASNQTMVGGGVALIVDTGSISSEAVRVVAI
jgi:hypothetical protein